MSDVLTKAKRSEVMSRIRSRGNRATELALAKLFRRHKITGWRRHVKIQMTGGRRQVTGKAPVSAVSPTRRHRPFAVRPDFVFPRLKLALFVDGCFWHGCPRHATHPKNNRGFWRRKLLGNRTRDLLVNGALRRANWRVLRIWECALEQRPQACLRRVQKWLSVEN